jgi:acetyltransferase-like isoleucine patch superfamily enzyme
MLQDYLSICEELERGDYNMRAPWRKIGPLWVLDEGGHILIGDVQFQGPVRIQVGPGAHVEIGDYTSINRGVEIHSRQRVVIGPYCLIAWNANIMDTDYHGIGTNPPVHKPTTLEEGVWVGNGAIILKGVTVGQGAVVSAGSVVTKDVAPFTVVGGAPARVITEIEPFEGKHGQIYERKWWDPSFIPLPRKMHEVNV